MPNLGPASTAADSSGVGQATSSGTFAAMLKQQERGLSHAPAGSHPNGSDGSNDPTNTLSADHPTLAIGLPLLPLALENVARTGFTALHSVAGLRQSPGHALGEMLPKAGNGLPPSSAATGSPAEHAIALAAPDARATALERPLATVAVAEALNRNGQAGPDSAMHASVGDPLLSEQGTHQTNGKDIGSKPAGFSLDTQQATALRIPAAVDVSAVRPAASSGLDQRPTRQEAFGIATYAGLSQTESSVDAAQGRPGSPQANLASGNALEWAALKNGHFDSAATVRAADLQTGAPIATASALTPSNMEGLSSNATPTSVAQPNPGGALVSRSMESPFGSGTWSTELAGHVHSLAREGNVQTAELRLNPAHLGPLEVKLSVRGDETSVTFIAPEGMVREVLQDTLPRLRELLSEQGLNLGQARVLDHSSDASGQQRPQEQSADKGGQSAPKSAEKEVASGTESLDITAGRPSSLIDAYI